MVSIEFDFKKVDGRTLIKDVLYNEATIKIMDTKHTDTEPSTKYNNNSFIDKELK